MLSLLVIIVQVLCQYNSSSASTCSDLNSDRFQAITITKRADFSV